MTRQACAVSAASAGRITVRSGDRPQRRVVLDRLVGGAVLPDPDRVVGEDPGDRQAHDRREPDRRPHVVGEDQEGRPVGPDDPPVQRQPVDRGAHRVLAHPPVDVAPGRGPAVAGLVGELGLGRAGQVGRAADHGRDQVGERLHHLAAGAPRGALRALEARQPRPTSPLGLPAQAASHSAAASRLGRPPALQALPPVAIRLLAALPGPGEGGAGLLGHRERRLRIEAEGELGLPRLLGAERRAVHPGRAGLVRRGPADHRAHPDQRGALLLLARPPRSAASSAGRSLASSTESVCQP